MVGSQFVLDNYFMRLAGRFELFDRALSLFETHAELLWNISLAPRLNNFNRFLGRLF